MVLKKIGISLACAVFIAALLCFGCGAAEAPSVRITSGALSVGEPIKTKVSGIEGDAVFFRWTVAGEETGVTGDSYIPSAADFSSMITAEIFDRGSGRLLGSDSVFFSPLPVVYLETDGGEPITSRDDYLSGTMKILGNAQYGKQYDGKIEIKGRGTSSWHYDKKPYKLKLDKKTDLFGFGAGKHFVLLANYLDPSLLRNTVGYKLASYLGLVSTDTVFVDVVLNGRYVGNYQLCEHIRVGEQLVDIPDYESLAQDAAKALAKAYKDDFPDGSSELKDLMTEDLSWLSDGLFTYHGKTYDLRPIADLPESLAGNYLLELGFDYDKEVTHFQSDGGICIAVSKPEYACTNEEMFRIIRQTYQDFEDAVKSPTGYNAKGQHYSELADLDSMVAYWLTMEILSNEDASGRSRYCYIDGEGKIVFGPVWDFDISSRSFRSYFPPVGWNVTATVSGFANGQDLFGDWVNDPLFQTRALEKYRGIRDYLGLLTEDGGIIDRYAEAIYESAIANEILWSGDGYMTRTFSGENGDLQVYKNFLKKRIAWLDTVFSDLGSLERSLRLPLAESSYRRSRAVVLSLSGQPEGRDLCLSEVSGLTIALRVPKNGLTSVYLNGRLIDTFAGAEGSVWIPAEALLGEGTRNVIEAVTDRGGRLSSNFLAVRFGEKAPLPLPEAPEPCAHTVSEVRGRTATAERYGLAECFYCAKCHTYFSDGEGQNAIAKSAVIQSPKQGKTGGVVITLRLAIAGVAVLLLIPPTVILIAVLRKRRKCKS